MFPLGCTYASPLLAIYPHKSYLYVDCLNIPAICYDCVLRGFVKWKHGCKVHTFEMLCIQCKNNTKNIGLSNANLLELSFVTNNGVKLRTGPTTSEIGAVE